MISDAATSARVRARTVFGVPASARAVRVALFVAALAGTGLVAFATARWGPAVNELALHHFTAAEGLRDGTGMTLSRGQPFVMWPPLLPVLLAIAHSLGLDYPTAGLALNLVAHTITLYLGAWLVWRLFGSAAVAFACMAMLLASPELLRSAGTLQTEPLFFALVLCGLYFLVRYLEQPTLGRWAAMTIVALLACLQRYTGVALVISVFLVMLRYPREQIVRTRAWRAALYSAIAMLPLVLWMLRNRRVNQTWGIIPEAAHVSVLDNALATARALARFLTLDTATNEPLRAFDVVTGLVALGLVLLVLVRLMRPESRVHPVSSTRESERRALIVYLVFPPVYLAVLVGVSSYVAIDPIGNRYVIPVYPFLWGTLLLGFREVHARLVSAPRAMSWSLHAALVMLFAAHFALAVDRTQMLVQLARDEGIGGLTTRTWQRSPIVEWLRANPMEGAIYSNVPEIVIFATGRRASFVTPESLAHDIEAAPSGAHLVWLERFPHPTPFPELPASAPLASVARLDGARVYEVQR